MMNHDDFIRQHIVDDQITPFTNAGTCMSIAANRISYHFDLLGVSLATDTACSSSLVAMHLARRALLNREASAALCGGVNALMLPGLFIALTKLRMLSADGRCKTFDASANGYVRSEGCGLVVLKSLPAAQQARDRCYAIVRGSALNSDGRSAIPITAPSIQSQKANLISAYKCAQIDPQLVQFVEAHGTGTQKGDFAETAALADVMCARKRPDNPLLLGSVKTNIGHAESASGIAGFIKAILCLRHSQIPQNLHFQTPNPNIDFTGLRVVDQHLSDWPRCEHTGRDSMTVGVNSFGFGGTNAHVVVQAAQETVPAAADRPAQKASTFCLPMSARTATSLVNCAASMANLLDSQDVAPLDVCYTAALRRTHHTYRLAVMGETRSDLCTALRDFASGSDSPCSNNQCVRGVVNESATPRLAFVFSGQGSHWAGMGVRLFDTCEVFQSELTRVDDLLHPLCGFSIIDELRRGKAARLTQPSVVQPAIFAIQVGVLAVLDSWGIVPAAVIGHSVGEVAAAFCAGALTLSQACKLVAVRSILCQSISSSGGMLAAKIAATRAEQELASADAAGVEIAAFNSRTSVTYTGSTEAIGLMAAALKKRSIPHKHLDVSGAFHSRSMDPIKAQLEEQLRDLSPGSCRVPFFSTVTAGQLSGEKLDCSYWWRNVRQPVRFCDTVAQVQSFGCDGFCEIGPHGILQGYLKEELPSPCWHMPTLVKPRDDSEVGRNDGLVHAVAQLFCRGVDCGWQAMYPHGSVVSLPAYQFDRQRCWVDLQPGTRATASLQELDTRGMLGLDATTMDEQTVVVQVARTGWVRHHVLQSKIVMPGTAFIEIALAAANQLVSNVQSDPRKRGFSIHGLKWVSPLFLDKTDVVSVAVDVQKSSCLPSDSWSLVMSEAHAAARSEPRHLIHATLDTHSIEWQDSVRSFADLQNKMPDQAAGTMVLSSDEVYHRFAKIGLDYTGLFRGIDEMWINVQSGTSVARICGIGYDSFSYTFHPALLDSILQSMSGALDLGAPLFPVEVESIRLRSASGNQEIWTHTQLIQSHDSYVVGNIIAYDSTGLPVVEITGFKVQLLGSHGTPATVASLMYCTRWQSQPMPELKVTANELGWIVFVPRNPLVPQLVQTVVHDLRERGLLCGTMTFGEQFSHRGDEWTVRPNHGEDIAKAISELDGPSLPCAGIVNMLAVDRLSEPMEEPGAMERIQRESCMPLIHLHQCYAVHLKKRAIVTVKFGGPNSSEDVKVPSLAQSFVDGIVRTSMLESTNVLCYAVNLSTGNETEGNALFRELLRCAQEVRADGLDALSSDFEVALEDNKRMVPRIERGSGEADRLLTGGRVVKAKQTYVLVGGLGGLGVMVAQWLLKLGADSLVLTSRSGGSTETLATLHELRRSHLHAQILVMRSDASDYSDLVAMFEKCKDLTPPIKGVFLCTMQLADAYIEAQTLDTVRSAMAAKMDAAWNLHVATLGLQLDFFVLFSSVSGLIGNRGQANYAAGNTFLDALALFRHRKNLPATAINWGPISGAGYLANNQDRLLASLEKQGMRPVSLEMLLQALSQIVHQQQLVQVACIDIDWATYLRNNYTGRARAIMPARLASIDHLSTALAVPVMPNSKPSDFASVEEQLRTIVSQILGIDRESSVSADTSLVSYGLDSLMSSELQLTIESNWNVAVPISNILQGASISDLAELISSRTNLSRVAGSSASSHTGELPADKIDSIDDNSGPGSFAIPRPALSPRLITRARKFASVVASPDELTQPFAMNDLQFAYYIGRSGAFGAAVPCHFYFEFDREHNALDIVQLEEAFNVLIARHEVLRSVVQDGMFVIKQSVPDYRFDVIHLEDHDDEILEQLRQKYSLEQFDPAQWPLFSVRITETAHFSRIHVNIDHIILDIKATLSLFSEWAHCYYYPKTKLPHIGFSYRDYSIASAQYKSSENINGARAYWMARLHQIPPAPPLPKSPASAAGDARSVFTRRTALLSSEQWAKLKSSAAQYSATAASVLCTAFCLVLARWSATYSFTINVPVFSKLPVHENVESVLGDFTSSILLQCDLELGGDFRQCVQNLQRQMSSDLDHVDFSGVAVLRELSRLPIKGGRVDNASDTTASGGMASMPVVFTSIIDSNAGDSYGWLGRNVYGISETPQVELDGHVYTIGDRLAVNFDFIAARYPAGMVNDMFDSYMQLLMTLATEDSSWTTKQLQILPHLQQVERTRANGLHTNERHHNTVRSLVHAFLPAMEANKLGTAVACGTVQLNYAQLLSTAVALCSRAELRELPPRSTVAIIMHKGWEQIVAVLATLLLGAAYVPLDAGLPHRRLSKLLVQCKAKAAFVQIGCSSWSVPAVAIDTGTICEPAPWTSAVDWITACQEQVPHWGSIQAHDLAYVLFTSGTTGVPKGVMVEHGSVLNTVNFVNTRFRVSSSDVFFGLSQLSFDLSVYDIFGSWTAGAMLVLPLENRMKDPTHWMSLVTQYRVSVWNSVPALMAWKLDSMVWPEKNRTVSSELSSLRLVLLSGDRIPANLPPRIRAVFNGANVVSLGGPTEDTIWSIINEEVPPPYNIHCLSSVRLSLCLCLTYALPGAGR